MNELSIPFKNNVYHFYYPASWDELNSKQLSQIVPLLPKLRRFYNRTVNGVGHEQTGYLFNLQKLRIAILKSLIAIPFWNLKRKQAFYSLYPDEVKDILQSLNFLLEQPYRTIPPFEYLVLKKNTPNPIHYSPGKSLEALTGEEFHFATKALNHYNQNNDTQSLNELCTILYRPKGVGKQHNPQHPKYCGDQRIPFNRFSIDYSAQRWNKIPLQTRKIIAWWYGQMVVIIQNNYPDIFTQENTQSATNSGWIPIFRALAPNSIEFEAVGKMRLSIVLYELRETLSERRKQERKNKAL